ncbi:MAG: tetratricopeptide repeat protein [Chitinophagales bacterium]|nr:tetratricopeptide repeat protein [Chitinophagales bacterium]
MRRLIGMFFLLLFSSNILLADEQDSLFSKASTLYQQRNYDKAYLLYDGLNQEGNASFQLFYNYANTCVQKKNYAKAIAYYEKALKLSPHDAETQSNLLFLKKKLAISDDSYQHWRYKICENTLYVLTIVSIWLWIILLSIIFLIIPIKKRRPYLYSASFFIVLSIYLLYNSMIVYRNYHIKHFAIVQEEYPIYNLPTVLSEETYDLFLGQKVEILDEKSGWSKVNSGANKTGWFPTSKLIEI